MERRRRGEDVHGAEAEGAGGQLAAGPMRRMSGWRREWPGRCWNLPAEDDRGGVKAGRRPRGGDGQGGDVRAGGRREQSGWRTAAGRRAGGTGGEPGGGAEPRELASWSARGGAEEGEAGRGASCGGRGQREKQGRSGEGVPREEKEVAGARSTEAGHGRRESAGREKKPGRGGGVRGRGREEGHGRLRERKRKGKKNNKGDKEMEGLGR